MAEERADRVKVRTTFRPDVETEMSAVEAEDLRRQGLIQEDQKGGRKATGGSDQK